MTKVSEVHVVVYRVPSCDLSEEKHAEDCEHEEHEHEQGEHVEEGGEGEGDCLDQCLDALVLADEAEDTGDTEHPKDSGDLGGHLEDLEGTTLGATTSSRRSDDFVDKYVHDGGDHNNEIEFVPSSIEVTLPICYQLKYSFYYKDSCEYIIESF